MGLLESLDVYPKKARVSGSKRRVQQKRLLENEELCWGRNRRRKGRSSGYLSILSFWPKWALGHKLIDSRWFEKNPPNGKWLKTRRSKKNAHVPVFRAEMLVTQYVLEVRAISSPFDLHTLLRLTRALCRSLVVEGGVVCSWLFVKL